MDRGESSFQEVVVRLLPELFDVVDRQQRQRVGGTAVGVVHPAGRRGCILAGSAGTVGHREPFANLISNGVTTRTTATHKSSPKYQQTQWASLFPATPRRGRSCR